MSRNRVFGFVACALAALILAGCISSASPTEELAENPPEVEGTSKATRPAPSPTPCVPSTFDSIPSSLEPTDILIEYGSRGGLGAPDPSDPCNTPWLTLLADGSLYYVDAADRSERQTVVVHLTPEETVALVQRVLDQGLECLRSYTSPCRPPRRVGDEMEVKCVTDGSTLELLVRLPDGRLEKRAYYEPFAGDEIIRDIRKLLVNYEHPEAKPYVPEMPCLCDDQKRCWP